MALRRPACRFLSLLASALLVPACSSGSDPDPSTLMTAVAFPAPAPAGQWTWHAGSNLQNRPGVYGAQGVPAAANTPGARMQSACWTDAYGGLWIFGGRSYDESGAFGSMNDTWRWNGSAWAWAMGSKLREPLGTYGTKGVPAAANIPGGRDSMAFVSDSLGRLWVYGGIGNGATASGELSDLWRFDGTTWVWLSGNNDPGPVPVHGTQGVAAAANTPGGREQASAWIDAAGAFWLFGGVGPDSTGSVGHLNDLWKYDGTNWTWVKGSKFEESSGVYGTQGLAAAANTPGGRSMARTWTDLSGQLWLFGGYGRDSVGGGPLLLNDLWRFDGANWTWMKGSNLIMQAGVYGTQGVAAAANTPGARFIHTGARDAAGNFWMMGGDAATTGYMNDLWKFDGANWTWMSGSSSGAQIGVYGIQGTPAAPNHPGSRGHAACWFDAGGHFWVSAGEGYDSTGAVLQLLNDLWRYAP